MLDPKPEVLRTAKRSDLDSSAQVIAGLDAPAHLAPPQEASSGQQATSERPAAAQPRVSSVQPRTWGKPRTIRQSDSIAYDEDDLPF